MAWTKMIVVVDDDVNVHDEQAVLRAMFANCDFRRDIEIVNGPLDILDHAAPRLGAGCKIGFDATRKIKGEEVNGIAIDDHARAPTPTDCNPWASRNDVYVPDFGAGRCVFISVNKRLSGDGARVIQSLWQTAPPLPKGLAEFVIAVDSSVDIRNWQAVFFHLCANCDPGRDLIRERVSDTFSAPPSRRIGFDATKKMPGDERNGQPVRDYPPILEMDAATKSLVDRRWREYGFTDD